MTNKEIDYYKENCISLGGSDIASLVLVGITEEGLKSEFLHFGEDGAYRAYIIHDDEEVPNHYTLRYTFNTWMQIYDDDSLIQKFYADKIEIYRAGEFGCLIKLVGEKVSGH